MTSVPVVFSDTPVQPSFGEITRETDVTSIVKPILDAAPAGNVDQTVNEVNNTSSIDGEGRTLRAALGLLGAAFDR